jgi:nucleoside-diphosphate-sugar epimerase
MQTIAITGSSGYLGGYFVNYFLNQGYKVIAMQREVGVSTKPNLSYLQYSMPQAPSEASLKGVNFLIHCAYQPYSTDNDSDQVNIQGTLNLAETCKKLDIKMVFMSTMSAHAAASSHYGQHKFELESKLGPEVLIIKSGLVIGDGGVFKKSVDAIKSSKFIPLFDGGNQPLQTIAIAQLAQAIEIGLKQNMSGLYEVAEEKATTMKAFYQEIIKDLNLKRVLIPFPIFMALIMTSLAEKLKIKLPFATENVKGLQNLIAFDTTRSSQVFGIKWQTFQESIKQALS